MTTNNPFLEPMSTAAMNSGSDLTVDLILQGVGMKMGLTSRNAGVAVIGLTCFAVGVVVGAFAVSKLDLKSDNVIELTKNVTSEELRARLEALESGNAKFAGTDTGTTLEHEQQIVLPEIGK